MRGNDMKKVLLIIGIGVGLVVLSPFLLLGVYALDFVYYGANDDKAEKAALEYLEEKYSERFEIDDVEYNKILGDDEGDYTLTVHPVANPDITFGVDTSEKYQVIRDSFKENNWSEQFRKEMVPLIEPIFKGTGEFYVYGSFPSEIEEQYRFEDSYQTIYNENPHQSYERIHILNFDDTFDREKEFQRIYQLWEGVKDRRFSDNNIEIDYYPNELKEKLKTYPDLKEFENEHRQEMTYTCRFSKQETQEKPITIPGDIEAFCRQM
ncbi:MAG: murein transglycosylase [Neobacillus sp.]|nr:murein transglycosylase [Neobacillus sp.]